MIKNLFISKKYLKELDFTIIFTAIIIAAFGTLNILSATSKMYGTSFAKKQFIIILFSLAVMYVVVLIDYTIIQAYTEFIYWGCIALLVVNNIFAKTINGANSWIRIGGFSLQASEFAKIGLILIVAKKIDSMEGNINNVKNFFKIAFYAIIPLILIVKQSDAGMTMVCFFIVLGMVFIAGLNLKVIIGGLSSIVVLITIVWNTSLMKPYWKDRLTTFLHPEDYAQTLTLQLNQSMIAIGSGKIFGTGFGKSVRAAGGYVPEAHNDYIFSVVGEEWGLIGAMFLLTLYAILIIRIINIARKSKDIFGSLVCVGIVSLLMFSIAQNIGMTIGIMPTTGITLPFMSYGGSSILSSFICIGLVLNIGMRRKKINF